jgi:chromosome segregation ATPase
MKKDMTLAATQQDVVDIRQDITNIQRDIKNIQQDSNKMQAEIVELRADITDIRSNIVELRKEMRQNTEDILTELRNFASMVGQRIEASDKRHDRLESDIARRRTAVARILAA